MPDVDAAAVSESGGGKAAVSLAGMAQPQGYISGFTQNCVLAQLDITLGAGLAEAARRLPDILEAHLPTSSPHGASRPAPAGADAPAALLHAIVSAAERLQECAQIAPVGRAKVNALENHRDELGREAIRLTVALPSLKPAAAAAALNFATRLADVLLHGLPEGTDAALTQDVGKLLEALGREAPRCDRNTRHLIRAAIARDLPIQFLLAGVVQIGWGSRARRMCSLATEATPLLATRLSGDKLVAAGLLRSIGVPIPVHESVGSSDAAVGAAARIGYPVVVKPADKERGEGVTADLRTEAEVRRAFAKAGAISRNIMVEKHVEGAEYRLLVVNGKLFWAFERVPARVRGDGVSTVAQLIAAVNGQRGDGPRDGLQLQRINVDDEVREMLRRHGSSLDAVPAPGEIVRLRRVPLVMNGGELVPVLDRVHPQNAAIAERAVRMMQLDIAGVDMLIPDIARPWRDVGGRITEVNAVPQLSPLSWPDIYPALLDALVAGDGRVPVVLLVGGNAGPLAIAAGERLAQAGIVAGVGSGDRVLAGGIDIADGASTPFQAAAMLIRDPSIDAIVLACTIDDLLRHGLPMDRIAALAIADADIDPSRLRGLFALATPHLTGKVLVADGGAVHDITCQTFEASRVIAADSARLPELICTAASG